MQLHAFFLLAAASVAAAKPEDPIVTSTPNENGIDVVPDERAVLAKLQELHARWPVSATGHVTAVTIDASAGQNADDLDLNFLSVLSRLEKLAVFQAGKARCLGGADRVATADVLAVPGAWRSRQARGHNCKDPELAGVGVRRSDIGSAGVAQLANMHALQSLTMHGGVSDESLDAIAPAQKLTTLVLARTEITLAGLKAIEGLVHLEVLQFPARCGTDAGLEHLQKLVKLRRLGKIAGARVPGSFADTGVSDRGAAFLRNMTELEELDLAARISRTRDCGTCRR